MYRSSCINFIRSENPIFRWGYLCVFTPALVAKFKSMARMGVPGSDWVSGSPWGSPILAIAPPLGVVQYNG